MHSCLQAIVVGPCGGTRRSRCDIWKQWNSHACGSAFRPDIGASGGAAIQPDGKIVVAGWTKETEVVVIRHKSDGSLDTAFGGGGSTTVPLLPARDPGQLRVTGVAIDSQGRIVVAGYNEVDTLPETFVLRLLSNGARDPGFGTSGVVQVDQLGSIGGLSLESDDRILVGGVAPDFATVRGNVRLVRLNVSGGLDTSFGSLGVATVPGIADQIADIRSYALARAADGKIIVVAGRGANTSTAEQSRAIRWFGNGTLDSSFGSGGVREFSVNAASSYYRPTAVTVSLDGRIAVGSNVEFGEKMEVTRFLPDGSRDTSFGSPQSPGFARLAGPDSSSLTELPDGRYLTASGSSDFRVDQPQNVYRYDSFGSPDTTWGENGSKGVDILNSPSPIGNKLLVQPDGRILLFGTRTPDGQPAASLRLIRLQAEPGIVTSARGTLTTTESGTTATFDVRLSSQPSADVTIPVTTSDTFRGDGAGLPTRLHPRQLVHAADGHDSGCRRHPLRHRPAVPDSARARRQQ